jgi:hypothetical protein
MTAVARLANSLWLAAGTAQARRFERALAAPAEDQDAMLRGMLARDANSLFGASHDFARIRGYADFARAVPIATYAEHVPWIERIRRGEPRVLGGEPVTRLLPTSGSTGARKLIPFTAGLARAFNAAVAPWLRDLARQRPALPGGPAYWSVSPLAGDQEDEPSVVPVGFADDSAYLGRAAAWLVARVLAVPSSARLVQEASAFWPLVLLALLRRRELRLVSVWHPSFFELLVGAAESDWATLLDAVESGGNPWLDALPPAARPSWRARADRGRALELRRIGPLDWPRWWPQLQVLSCWGDQAAAGGWRRLAGRLPGVLVQPKGLLATEAVVTVPIGEHRPLAVTSHFFEFLDTRGGLRRAHELERGSHYEVVVTNGGGLWRYPLGDVVECTGRLAATPTLRFLGRAGAVSDLRGEKLAEPFVAEALRALWNGGQPPGLALLRAWDDGFAAGYELLLSTETLAEPADALRDRLERALAENPHYALARRLGQLAPLRVVPLGPEAAQQQLRAAAHNRGLRLGEVKPATLLGPGTAGNAP